MKFKFSQLCDVVVIVFVVGVIIVMVYVQEVINFDCIEVIGLCICQVDIEMVQLVLSLSCVIIEKSGFKMVVDVLQNIFVVGSLVISCFELLFFGEMVGGYYIDLCNLGVQCILILVDGKCFGVSVSGYQDVLQILLVIVECIDVLKDGVFLVYGFDVMVGVINIIICKNFEGLEVNVYIGQYSEGDGQKQSVDFVVGFIGDCGLIIIGVEYFNEKVVWVKDCWFFELLCINCYLIVGWILVSQWGLVFDLIDLDVLLFIFNRGGNFYNVVDFYEIDLILIIGDVSNFNQQMQLLILIKCCSVFVNLQYDFIDNVCFSGDLLYICCELEVQVVGYLLQFEVYVNFGFIWLVDSYYNLFGQDMVYVCCGWEVLCVFNNKLMMFCFSGVLQGLFQFNDKYFDWEVGYFYQNFENNQSQIGNYNVLVVNVVIGVLFYNLVIGCVECGIVVGLVVGINLVYGFGVGGCILWNLVILFGCIGDGGLIGNLDLQQFLFLMMYNVGEIMMMFYYVNIVGSILILLVGDLGFVLGYEYCEEKGNFNLDVLLQLGYFIDLVVGLIGGKYDVNEVYLELNVLILVDLFGVKELSLSVVICFFDFSIFGNMINSKFGLKWCLIDQLLVCVIYFEGFCVLIIVDLYGGSLQFFEYFIDLCDILFGLVVIDVVMVQ